MIGDENEIQSLSSPAVLLMRAGDSSGNTAVVRSAYQCVGAAGDDEVDDVIMGEQLRDSLARGDETNEVAPDLRRFVFDGADNDVVQNPIAVLRLLATLQAVDTHW